MNRAISVGDISGMAIETAISTDATITKSLRRPGWSPSSRLASFLCKAIRLIRAGSAAA
jgi:hypothetical protein